MVYIIFHLISYISFQVKFAENTCVCACVTSMGNVKIEQIQFFHALRLQPIAIEEVKTWSDIVENYLISVNNIKSCRVLLESIKPDNKITIGAHRGSRKIKKKACCCMCMY